VNFETLKYFSVSSDLIRSTEKELKTAGKSGYELFVLWTGTISQEGFVTRSMHVPRQTSYKLNAGLCVRVDGSVLHELNRWLYEHQEFLGVQIHSHPSEAYHSDTDDAYPIVTTLGGLSIVVPDFCQGGFFSPGTVAYRLQPNGWAELGPSTFRSILHVDP